MRDLSYGRFQKGRWLWTNWAVWFPIVGRRACTIQLDLIMSHHIISSQPLSWRRNILPWFTWWFQHSIWDLPMLSLFWEWGGGGCSHCKFQLFLWHWHVKGLLGKQKQRLLNWVFRAPWRLLHNPLNFLEGLRYFIWNRPKGEFDTWRTFIPLDIPLSVLDHGLQIFIEPIKLTILVFQLGLPEMRTLNAWLSLHVL